MKILQYDNTDKKLYYDLTNLSIKLNVDYSKNYFTTEMLETGSISFSILSFIGTEYIESISYSLDNGNTWTTNENTDNKSEDLVITVNAEKNDIILWKGIAKQLSGYDEDTSGGTYRGSYFNSEIKFNAYGNIMSLFYGDDFVGKTEFKPNSNYQCLSLFSDYFSLEECNIVDASNLILPVLNLSERCYMNLFWGCTFLTKAPKLPATTLAERCYQNMFYGCTALTTAPALPATTLTMNCYSGMFSSCTSLILAPELPATILANGCYGGMFYFCTSLTTAPVLPATTLVENCYSGMFEECSSLNYIKALFTTTPSTDYTADWVLLVAATGTFVKNSNATWNEVSGDGVPLGWTIKTADK